MQHSDKPDLDETLNVTSSHERMLRDAAAVAREKHVNEGGSEPMSLWIFAACAVILLAGGLALGNAGSFFNYNQTVKPDYVRILKDAEGGGPPPVTALKAYMAQGSKIYGKCIGCHAPDGKGGGAYPALAGSDWVLGDDTERFAMVILNGLSGPTSTGKDFGVMPAQGIGMGPRDLAAVMTYVRNSFGNSTGDVITEEMAAEAIKISEARANPGTPVTAGELDAEHAKPLPGEPLDPATMLNPVTLEPAEE